jgi:hypothetical protein
MKMSHPDPCYDPDNSCEDDMYDIDANYDDHDDFHQQIVEYYDENHGEDYDSEEDYDDSMDGDHDSAMESAGWGTDEDYGYYGEDF